MTDIVGLIDVDYKMGRNVNNTKTVFPNLALMKISAWHKGSGDAVEWYNPNFRPKYDRVYASKVFRWKSPMDDYVPNRAIKGGTGYDLATVLPNDVEHARPDYSLYGIDYAMGFLTRGCVRKCPWCFVGETSVLTDKGVKNIEDIKIGDFVLDSIGFNKVINVIQRKYKGRGIKFNTTFNKQYTICTYDHHFPLSNGDKEIGNVATTEDLLIALPKGTNSELNLLNYIDKKNWSRNPITKSLLCGDELKLFCELGGWYLAEGHIHKHKDRKESYTVGFSLSMNERDEVQRIMNIIDRLFGIKTKIYKRDGEGRNNIDFFYHRKELALLLLSLFGKGAKNKFIHKDIFSLGNEFIVQLLKGYFKGDGSLINTSNDHHRITSASVSYSLSLSIALLLRRLGYDARIEKRQLKDSCIGERIIKAKNTTYLVHIARQREVVELSRILFDKDVEYRVERQFTTPEKKMIINKIERDDATKIEDRCRNNGIVFQTYYRWKSEIKNNKKGVMENSNPLFTRIYDRQEVDLDCIVYNITVEDTHKYNVNGILTNNCIVFDKEGAVHKHADLEEFWSGQEKVMLLDNNLLAYSDHLVELQKLKETGCKVQFNQGLDIRFVTEDNAKLLKEIKRWEGRRLHFAFDDIRYAPILEQKLPILYGAGFVPNDFMFYVLIGFNSTEEDDLKRINFLKERELRPYIAPFDRRNLYQRALKRYVNFKPYFWKMSWEEFLDTDDHLHTKKYLKSRERKKSKNIGSYFARK